MSVSEDEEKDIGDGIKQQQETCPVKTLAIVSLSVSLTALVISCVFGTLVIISYLSPETNVDKIPDLCRLPPDPGPCSSSVNRKVVRYIAWSRHCHKVLNHTQFLVVSGGITCPVSATVSSSPGADVTAMTTTLSASASVEQHAGSGRRTPC